MNKLKSIKNILAKVWAKKHTKKIDKDTQNALLCQEKILFDLVRSAKRTKFGIEYDFKNIRSIHDFVSRVPLHDYEKLKSYIDRIKNGERNILSIRKPKYFAKTSGTTSGVKYIPISNKGIYSQIKAARGAILSYIAKKNNADFVDGKMIFLQGSPKLSDLNGIKVGRLSGIVDHHIPKYLQRNRLPSWNTNTTEDWETKIDKIIEETENQNMTLISGIPPWLIMYFEKLKLKHSKNIKQIFPNLQLIVTGGVNYEPYREKINQLLGTKDVDIIQTFPASEGFFAYQDNYKRDDLLLLVNDGIFYEFVPIEDLDKEKPLRFNLSNVETDRDYAMVITTNSGLWAYMIGDIVRFTSIKPYRILVTGRTSHFTSAFGEHVIAYEVEEALKETVFKYPAQISEFHLAPEITPEEGLPYHEWLIEFEKEPESIEKFSYSLDLALRKRNTYYNDLISGSVLKPLVITRLKKDSFLNYAKYKGKLGGQNKIPRLSNDRSIADFFYNSDLGLIIKKA